MSSKTETEQVIELREWLSTGRARRLRVDAGISQEVAARTVGVGVRSIVRWEGGHAVPSGLYAREYHKFLEHLSTLPA